MSLHGRTKFTGMNQSLQQIFTGGKRPSFKNKGKTWDGEAHQGNLWIWMGAFKRWKKRCFSCAQPGLLTYNSPPKRGRKVTGGSINLHKAIITTSPDDPRYFRIQTPTGSAFHLRTVDAEDRELCVASIKASAGQYQTLLGRASLLASNLGAPLSKKHSGRMNGSVNGVHIPENEIDNSGIPLDVKLTNGEPQVLKDVQERVASRMEDLEPFQMAVESKLHAAQESLAQISKALSPDPPKQSDSLEKNTSVRQVLQREFENPRLSRGISDSRFLESGLSLTRADSFQSAMSDLQRSPTSHLASTNDLTALTQEEPLCHAWSRLNLAIEDGFRSEATKAVELQAENDALKAAMRVFKNQAQKNARTLGSFSPQSMHQRFSSDSEEDLARHASDSVDDLDLKHLSSPVHAECREAIEALEAVQRHAFAVRNIQDVNSIGLDPPPTSMEYEEVGSDDEGISEPGSRQPSMSQELSHHTPVSIWELAAQRDRLPNPAPLHRGFSIWSVLKSAIGKDLTRITLPATINEPLSALQRIAEDLEYKDILDEALACQDSGIRTLLVAAFIASGYSATLKRESKPFNPLLGETFEWQSPDSSCRFFCEQVSHHPPVSCWWSESTSGWQYFGEMELRSKFWGKSVEMLPTGTCWLKLGDELWSWNKANMSINNIIIGTYWLDWYGTITLRNHTTGGSTVMQFPKSSGRNLDQRGIVVCSSISEKDGSKIELKGKYTDRLTIMDAKDNALKEVFRINCPVEQGTLQYNMTRMAMTLNTSERELFRQLPPTDSRFRPDQRALEDAELDKATEEKLRLEEKQRQVRKERKEGGLSFFPSWFRLRNPSTQQTQGADHWLGSQLVRLPIESPPCMWEFSGEYWNCKAKKDWSRCPDIYSGGSDALPSPY